MLYMIEYISRYGSSQKSLVESSSPKAAVAHYVRTCGLEDEPRTYKVYSVDLSNKIEISVRRVPEHLEIRELGT